MSYASITDREKVNLLQNDLHLAGYPVAYEVPLDVYESAERVTLDWLHEHPLLTSTRTMLVMGENGGLMFKNVELLIKKD